MQFHFIPIQNALPFKVTNLDLLAFSNLCTDWVLIFKPLLFENGRTYGRNGQPEYLDVRASTFDYVLSMSKFL